MSLGHWFLIAGGLIGLVALATVAPFAGGASLGPLYNQGLAAIADISGDMAKALADTQTEIERDIARAIEQGRINYEALMWQARQAHRAASGLEWEGVANLVGNWGKAIAMA